MPALVITHAVGKNRPNKPQDVKAVARVLMEVGKVTKDYVSTGELDRTLVQAIINTQRHWTSLPDGALDVGGRTHRMLEAWETKPISPGVQLPGRLQEAWDLVNPLLPRGSYCSSGFRSADSQRRILHNFYRNTYREQIISKYTKAVYDAVAADLVKNEPRVLEMVRGVGQAIAAPGHSAHQAGKAIDIGGPSAIDDRQVRIVKLVAAAHSHLFSGKVLKERNGCVHFEIR